MFVLCKSWIIIIIIIIIIIMWKEHIYIKCVAMNEWTSVSHIDYLREYISQNTAHND